MATTRDPAPTGTFQYDLALGVEPALTAAAPEPVTFGGLPYFPRQWSAVAAPLGPVLVLAGPGAGKTRCLTGRIRYLIEEAGAAPARICGVTFTNKAADEIRHRLRSGLGPVAEHLWLGTIHALCLELLRPRAKSVDLPPGFGLADESHQLAILMRLGVPRNRRGNTLTQFGRHRLADAALTPGDAALFGAYAEELRQHRLIDYDDIIALTRRLFERDPGALTGDGARWDHLLIDEFQDLDPAQYSILKDLGGAHRSVFAVGDDEQSIFTWRGADPSLARRFQQDFRVESPIVLDVNCRCSVPILEAARRVLPDDAPLFPKDIRAFRLGEPVTARGFETEAEEAEWVADDLLADLSESGLARGEVAVLYRRHEMGERMEQTLLARGVPCQLGRGRALVDDPVIGQLVTSLRIVRSPDSQLDLEALARGRLPEPLLMRLDARGGGSLLDRIADYAHDHHDTDAKTCWRVLYQVENLKQLGALHRTLPELVDGILALGVGRFANPLERHLDHLSDPAVHAQARELSDALERTVAGGGGVFVSPGGGLEVPVAQMLRRALPGTTVGYLQGGRPEPNDLVLSLSPVASAPCTIVALAGGDGLRVTPLFKALQLHETRDSRRLLSDYVVFDTETTDKDVDSCEVVEIAAVRVRGGKPVESFRSLVRCERPISPAATAIHGYADGDLAGQPALAEVWPRFRAFVGDSVLVAHNAFRFDVPVLERLTAPWGGLEGVPRFDSLPLARQLFRSGGLRLDDLAVRFDVPTGRSHHALDDCHCLAGVVERLLDEHLRQGRLLCQAALLEWVALGAALEPETPRTPEEERWIRAGTWRLLGRHSSALETYAAEAAAGSIAGPTVDEITDSLGGPELVRRVRRETSPHERYADAYDRFRQLLAASEGTDLSESIRRFLDTVTLSRSDGSAVDPDRVSLLTFHGAKGLEFSRVYVLGVEDNELPGYYAMAENRVAEIQEARRLLYVAMTRAKDRLVLTHARMRRGKPSGGTRFLDDAGLGRDS